MTVPYSYIYSIERVLNKIASNTLFSQGMNFNKLQCTSVLYISVYKRSFFQLIDDRHEPKDSLQSRESATFTTFLRSIVTCWRSFCKCYYVDIIVCPREWRVVDQPMIDWIWVAMSGRQTSRRARLSNLSSFSSLFLLYVYTDEIVMVYASSYYVYMYMQMLI